VDEFHAVTTIDSLFDETAGAFFQAFVSKYKLLYHISVSTSILYADGFEKNTEYRFTRNWTAY